MESINDSASQYTQEQLTAIKEMIKLHPVMKQWSVGNLYPSSSTEDGVINIPIVSDPDGNPY